MRKSWPAAAGMIVGAALRPVPATAARASSPELPSQDLFRAGVHGNPLGVDEGHDQSVVEQRAEPTCTLIWSPAS